MAVQRLQKLAEFERVNARRRERAPNPTRARFFATSPAAADRFMAASNRCTRA